MSEQDSFAQLGLDAFLLKALDEMGYKQPTPVQTQSIPILLSGKDLVGQAQTGTGKTAAFALPILASLDLALKKPQALILAPTRELAIQVTEGFTNLGKYLKNFYATSIYGGQDYNIQVKLLKRGSHVIIGTPGRILDLLKEKWRGTLSLDNLKTVILDEADEMLNMGFLEDVEKILDQISHPHQTGLFSATIPPAIKQISKRFLDNPEYVHIEPKQSTVETIEQLYIPTRSKDKLEVLIRLLQVEKTDAVIIFVKTRQHSSEVAEQLQIRGFSVAALNGDMQQNLRKKTIEQIKKGSINIIVATDVAARGIDVERVSHVINYDAPFDVETYIHRIGRTGRAGRHGKAILMIGRKETRLLNAIKHKMNNRIQLIKPPTLSQLKQAYTGKLKDKFINVLKNKQSMKTYYEIIEELDLFEHYQEKDLVAAALFLMNAGKPLLCEGEEIKACEFSDGYKRRDNRKDKQKHNSNYRNQERNKRKPSFTQEKKRRKKKEFSKLNKKNESSFKKYRDKD